MRRATAILFLVVLVIAEFGATAILLDFHVESERIIAELCVERDLLPEMQTCKGQCHLSKKLKEVTSDPENQSQFVLFEYVGKPASQGVVAPPTFYREEADFFSDNELNGFVRSAEPVPWRF